MAAPKTARKASEALKGAAVPVEESAAPAGSAAASESLFGLPPASESVETVETPAPETVNLGKVEEPTTTPTVEATPVTDPAIPGMVDVVVIGDSFAYFADGDRHTSARKGTRLSLAPAVASRGFALKMLAPAN